MKKILCCSIFLFVGYVASAAWVQLQTGINDHFTGVVFWGQYGLLSGHKGLYYSLDGGDGAAHWTRFTIQDNQPAADLYNRTRFTHCFSAQPGTINTIYACGQDTVDKKAVVFRITLPDLTYSLVYTGEENSALHNIGVSNTNDFYGVGDDGLVVKWNATSAAVIPTGLDHDLRAISIYGSQFWIAGENARIWGTSISNFTFQVYPGTEVINDVFIYFTGQGVGAGNGYYHTNGGATLTEYNSYDFGALNARCILRRNYTFVGTDHGIFRSTGEDYSISLEWQPSAGTHVINELWLEKSTANLYACGNDGVLLKTIDWGGTSKPYAQISQHPGACVNTSVKVSAFERGTSSSCYWYLNGRFVSLSCLDFTRTYDSVGLHTVDFVVANSLYRDTATMQFRIVEKPDANIDVEVSDTILCQQESVVITLNHSQPEVQYWFRRIGSPAVLGYSTEGNNTPIAFSTLPITSSGAYYVRAESTQAACVANIPETLNLVVEKTSANFHTDLLNVGTGESVTFYAQTRDAQHYKWEFPAPAALNESTDKNPVNHFLGLEPSNIKLTCWSDDGCTATIEKPGPRVYALPAVEDTCWVNLNKSVDPDWSGNYYEDIAQLSPSKTGYFICGYHNYNHMATQHGDSLYLETNGAYMAKYDFDGTVKWKVQTLKYTGERDEIVAVTEDENGYVYISGYSNGTFYDNAGDSVLLDQFEEHFIIKLDARGKLIWALTNARTSFQKIIIDHAGDLVVLASNGINEKIYLNGQLIDTIATTCVGCNHLILKISPDGYIQWEAPVRISSANESGIYRVGIDQHNHLYVTGAFEQYVDFYSSDNSTPHHLVGWLGDYGGKLFLAKYDQGGLFQWCLRSSTDNGQHNSCIPYDMKVDHNGNCYISGSNDSRNPGGQLIFDNTDGSATTTEVGTYFLAKVNSDGICQWIQGNQLSYYGIGYNVHVHNNEISVLGEWANQSIQTPSQSTFSSASGKQITITQAPWDFFIAVYDTSGNLLRIMVNGINADPDHQGTFTAPGMFRLEEGSYYFARNIYHKQGGYRLFGEILGPTTARDGYVARIDEGCAITYLPGYNRVDTISVCAGSTVLFPDGSSQIIEQPVVQASYFTAASGEDSTIITNVTLIESVDTGIAHTDDGLIANQSNMTYQWLDCGNQFTPVPGATTQTFIPAVTGLYAVELTGGICKDTSACVNFMSVSAKDFSTTKQIAYYPNPTSGTLRIELGIEPKELLCLVYNSLGEFQFTKSFHNLAAFELTLPEIPGWYVLALMDERKWIGRIRVFRN